LLNQAIWAISATAKNPDTPVKLSFLLMLI
jgi:hypothetical protein